MPLSNVFRHSIPNPFHGPSRKARHGRSGSVGSITSGIAVAPILTDGKPMGDITNTKPKPKEKHKQRKNSKRNSGPKSKQSSILACHLEQLDHAHITGPVSPSDLISELAILKPSSQVSESLRVNASNSTDLAFPPGPMSQYIDMPSTPSAPSTTSSALIDRCLSSSPEPMTPTLQSPATINISPTSSIESKIGATFSEGHVNPEETAPQQASGTEQEPKKKRLSAGTIHIPISNFITNTFKLNKQGVPVHQHQEQQQEEEQTQLKKRRSLLSKLPKLDTRPRIIISPPMPKGGAQSDKKQNEVKAQDQENQGESSTPGSSASFAKRSGIRHGHSFASTLLTPFYLPTQLRSGVFNLNGSKATQPQQPTFDSALLWDWRQNSQLYHDERWDRASVVTTDSELVRPSDDPNFLVYPERNAYWQKHCRIRERRRNKQQLGLQRQQAVISASKAIDDGNQEDSDDYDIKDNGDQSKTFGTMGHSRDNRLRNNGLGSQSRCRDHRVRYTTYSAYMAAMQRKAKNRAERKKSDASMVNERLLNDMRVRQQRFTNQETSVKTFTDRLESSAGTGSVRPTVDLDRALQQQQQRFGQRRHGTNFGSNDENSDDQGREYSGQPRRSPQRHRQQSNGILFIPSKTTTAEVYPSLMNNPQRDSLDSSYSAGMQYFRTEGQNTCMLGKDGFGVVSIEDEKIGCLVASYFDKKLFEEGNDSVGLPGALSCRSSPSTVNNNNSAARCANDGSSNSRGNGQSVILSQPGQYAFHNHIMPLQQLLDLQEQERQNLSSSNSQLVHKTSVTSQQQCDSTDLSVRSPQSMAGKPSQEPNGYMLLMLVQGRWVYYEKGSRKREPQRGDVEEMYSDGNLYENGVIVEEEEEAGEEDRIQKGHQYRQFLEAAQDEGQIGGVRVVDEVDDRDVLVPICLQREITGMQSGIDQSILSFNNVGSPGTFDGPLSTSTSDSNFAHALVPPPPQPVSNTASRASSLGRIRGAKSRASISYSIPTIATSSYSALAPSSISSDTIPSTASLTHSTSLRHRDSGSMTPGSITAGMTSPGTPSTPQEPSWSDLSRYPISASAMLLGALSKPMKNAYLLQQNDSQRQKRSHSRSWPLRSSTGSANSTFSTSSKHWIRKSILRTRSDESAYPVGSAQHALQRSLQLRRPSRTWGYPGTTDEEEANEAEREMAQELLIEENVAPAQSPRSIRSNSLSSPGKKRSRTLSMVELSAATSASQNALLGSMTRRRYKAEALTSTTTAEMLRPEGDCLWSEFFDD
ncbi:hypothetical protein BGX28_005682 [Mortierella sp. GBA30]|nr:hypothetical protein BGX28_005682 [Mortierella sp. GBA30]